MVFVRVRFYKKQSSGQNNDNFSQCGINTSPNRRAISLKPGHPLAFLRGIQSSKLMQPILFYFWILPFFYHSIERSYLSKNSKTLIFIKRKIFPCITLALHSKGNSEIETLCSSRESKKQRRSD